MDWTRAAPPTPRPRTQATPRAAVRQRRRPPACRPGPVLPWGRVRRPPGRLSGDRSCSVSRETGEGAREAVSRETVPGAFASRRDSAAIAASIRLATSAGMRDGPGRVLQQIADLLQGDPHLRTEIAVIEMAADSGGALRGSTPSVSAEISATSGCWSVSIVDVTPACLPSRHLDPAVVPPVGRMSSAHGSFPLFESVLPLSPPRRWESRGAGGPATGTPALDGSAGNTENPGGFCHGVPLHVDEHQGGALFRGRVPRACRSSRCRSPLGGCGGRFVGLQELLQPLGLGDRGRSAGSGLAGPVQTGVDGDAVKPGRDGRLAAEGVCGPVGRDEGVLTASAASSRSPRVWSATAHRRSRWRRTISPKAS